MSAETIYPTVVFKSHVGSVFIICLNYLFTRNCTVMSVCSVLHFPVSLLHVNLYTHNTNSALLYYFVVHFIYSINQDLDGYWLVTKLILYFCDEITVLLYL